MVKELEDAIAKKNEELVKLRKDQIAEIEQKQKSLERIPTLEKDFKRVSEELTKLRSVLGFGPLSRDFLGGSFLSPLNIYGSGR